MIDKLIDCPLCKEKASCYCSPLNEKHLAYSCFGCGYSSNDLMKDNEFDIEQFEETLPELYKDLKKVDDKGRYWYPQAINIVGKGTVFANGKTNNSWQWSAIKSVALTEEEKKQPKFKNQTHKSDSSTLKSFEKDFIEALDYIGFFSVDLM
jgi:hypothetical protein